MTSNGGLQTAKREVVAVLIHVFWQCERARKPDGLRVAALCRPINLRPARVVEPENASHLVEGLAGGIVDGFAEQFDVVNQVANQQQRCVPAANQQRDGRSLNLPALEHVNANVPNQVVDGIDRLVERDRESLCRCDANHQRTGETRAVGNRNRIDFV